MMTADVEISELLLECDKKNVPLPENSWEALREVIVVLRNTQHDALGYVKIPKALEQLKRKFGDSARDEEVAPVAPLSRVMRRQKRMLIQDMPESKRRNISTEGSSRNASLSVQSGTNNAESLVASKKKKKNKKDARKSRIQEEVEATPASRDENQALVDKLVQVGDYEMHHGHSQRGISRMRAAKAICSTDMVITSGAQAKQLDNVGPAVATKIDQLLNEGLTAALSEYEKDEEAVS
ncbi:hypothetical protein DD238_000208 [Peronospora effusa]|uniref:Crossover junction endonuclease MUS81-like HHH domain-containing protein n=1 Tax=Peronospora effusa TaxID=542832 RepID=A0A3M6VVE1_9STRA|nr:hypothetical protein DD238_000208 [Peronospora effusa]